MTVRPRSASSFASMVCSSHRCAASCPRRRGHRLAGGHRGGARGCGRSCHTIVSLARERGAGEAPLGLDAVHNSVITRCVLPCGVSASHGSWDDVKHTHRPGTLPRTPEDPSAPLSPGTHTITVPHGPARVALRYHVAGSGPVCLAHSGGPGIGWEYLRMPGLEDSLTMVYVEPVGTGDSGRLPDPRDYTVATYAHFLHAVVQHLN